MEMKKFFEEETQGQEDGLKNSQNQDAGNSFEEEVNRLKTLLDTERAKFNEEHQRANDLEKELHSVKLKLEKCKFNGNNVDGCSEANKGTNELLMENKTLQEVLAKFQTDMINLAEQVETLQEELEMEKTANSQTIIRGQLSSLQNASTEKETCLQREVDKLKEENLEMTKKFNTEVLTLKKRISSLERELKDNEEAHAEMAKINKLLYAELQTENETILQKLASVQDASKEAERCIQKELDQVKDATLEMVQKYGIDILALREEIQIMEKEQREERYRHAEIEIRNGKRAKFLHAEKNLLQKELDEVKRKLFLNEVKFKEQLDASAAEIERQLAQNHKISEELKLKDQEIAEAKAPPPVKKSLMKKFRHALGLRKPEKWKRQKALEENV